VKAYYHARAAEYDDCWLGRGRFAERDRPGWHEEVAQLKQAVASMPPAKTLDVACGTGFLTQHLRGEITGLDQSDAMLEIARECVPEATFVEGDALKLPFEDREFERLFTSYFYCHLEEPERFAFLAEARRVASELVVVATQRKSDRPAAHYEERVLDDGSRWQVYKRYFAPDELLEELGGGEVLFEGERSFLLVRSELGSL
jgi:ubiquinone/menaquinone biosynthesis C-methylase UbiE